MKAIIITDADSYALLDQLQLQKMREANHWPAYSAATVVEIEAAHRAFHYIVSRWLQEMGADTVRK